MAGGAAAPNSGNVQGQFEDLLSLVLARSRGEVGNEDVESALSSIVGTNVPGHVPPTAPPLPPPNRGSNATKTPNPNPRSTAQRKEETIIPDDDNYDDSDSDYDCAPRIRKRASTRKATSISKSKSKRASTKKATAITKKKLIGQKKDDTERQKLIEDIPLGKMGEKMLITFGDGPTPDLEVVSNALLGTRTSLQRAILDARAFRRREKDNWHRARAVATMHRNATIKGSNAVLTSIVDNELSFRAMDGFGDNLRFDVSCGFDIPQLKTLFPEEMGAYQRWKEMHEAYTEKNGEDDKKTPEEFDDAAIDDTNETNEQMETEASGQDKMNTGRLVGRLANFDARTNNMGDDWYLKFADVRRGSFLPRLSAKKQTSAVNYQKGMQVKRARGRPPTNRTSWSNLHPTSVIFLHWIGFDPKSALSPPNEETTQALGFLAYDFFGKIVEKAVYLRLDYDSNKNVKQDLSRFDSSLLELTGGDQIAKENIDQALAEVDLSSLYSSSNIDLGKSSKIAQLYFGPGFEDRLELEMDEIFGSKEKALSQVEMKMRQDEEHLFSELPEVPVLLSSVTDILAEDKKNNDVTKSPVASSKKKDVDAKKSPVPSPKKKVGNAKKSPVPLSKKRRLSK